MANPVLPEQLLQEAVPGNIRKAEHFLAFLERFVDYLRVCMSVQRVVNQPPLSFLDEMQTAVLIERKPLR
jgi:DNA excision repair protein ERCC-2